MNNQTKNFLELSQAERERNAAVELLQKVLIESDESDLDQDIYRFLEEIGKVPNNFIKYWEDDDDNQTDEYEVQ